MNLTTEQQAAVNHQLAHARIVAVAGAGKTATLVHYLAGRLASAKSASILVLMYNRAAQQAFSQRLRYQCAGPQALPQVRTFHALGLRMYKRLISDGWLPHTHLQPLAEVAVELQLKQLLQNSTKAQSLIDSPEQVQEWVELCRQFITLVKSDVAAAEAVAEGMNLTKDAAALVSEVFAGFESWRRELQAITYDDMLYDPAQVLLQTPNARPLFSDAFDEILVDEYQDINPIQHFLLKVIAGKRAQVMVIGDPDQTIYEFRGSSPQFITRHFAQDFDAPISYNLTRTFRFGHALALCANQLISRNTVREPILTISAECTPQSKIYLAACEQHGVKIAKAIAQLHSNGGSYSGMAVLCRLWSYARPVELELMARGIPYRIEGEQSILQCAEIRPLIHALDLISGDLHKQPLEQRQQHLFELLITPSLKIPHTLLRRICSTWAHTLLELPLRQSFLRALPNQLKPFQQRMLELMAAALRQLSANVACAEALQNYAAILDYSKRLREGALNPEKGQEQARTVAAFLQFAATVPTQSASELRQVLAQMQSSHTHSALDAVTLTTIHRSKGLEWPVVFLPNMAEGHLPCNPASGRQRLENEHSLIESERRLMYVAITRAQKQLFVTTPLNGSGISVSRFISEMNISLSQAVAQALYQQQEKVVLEHPPGSVVQSYLHALQRTLDFELVLPTQPEQLAASAPANPASWCIGERVRHAVLGLGHIRSVDDKRIRIHFDDGKTRTFISDLAQPHLSVV